MKFKLIFCIVFILGGSHFLSAQKNASVILDHAYNQAKTENKNVMVIFHASWCGWCKRMDNNINNAACKGLFDRNFVITHLAVKETEQNKHLENPGAVNLFNQYSEGNTGIPFWLIFDANGKLLKKSLDENGKNLGCPANEHEVSLFVDILRETTDMSNSELEIVKTQFLIN